MRYPAVDHNQPLVHPEEEKNTGPFIVQNLPVVLFSSEGKGGEENQSQRRIVLLAAPKS